MNNDFEDHNEFDRYAWEHGGWAYDNGWSYKDEFFGESYAGKNFGNAEKGDYDFLQMLRNGNVPSKTYIIHFVGAKINEIWSGDVVTKSDFDEMMEFVNKYIIQYEKIKRNQPSNA
ncbi:MAG: hypothetical protein HN390_13235 [Anaerolineae bacterium]|jgi:hypothetical protein|nr:hypothetical protein [Anaerolineae bacterium]MBT7189886.1 hypothetical protein [Anaerolineae bacterium]MBT7991944.1 hypothetical protein [Anaerolineae bacterium]